MSAMNALQVLQLANCARNAGFRHYAFLSYPGTDSEMKGFARRFHDRFESLLRQHLPLLDPNHDCVFLDKSGIPPGVLWEAALGQALCRSLTMIALCVPMYANSLWCGREWQGMTDLATARLPDWTTPFFVVRLGKLEPHPVIMAIQQFWMPDKGLRRLHLTAGFEHGLGEALSHVLRVLELSQTAVADCYGYRVPDISAFHAATTPVTPNRTP